MTVRAARPPADRREAGRELAAHLPETGGRDVTRRIPRWIKWTYTAFIALITPVYARQYGWRNFLWFSDVALFSMVPALWLESPLLASMQAVSITVPETGWTIDFAAQALFRRRPIGLADYMFDPKIPALTRALSLFHLWLPPLILWTVSRVGYDRRAFRSQTLASWILLPVTYAVTEPADDINWVYGVSGSPQQQIHRHLYLLLVMAGYPAIFHWPAHRVLTRVFPDRFGFGFGTGVVGGSDGGTGGFGSGHGFGGFGMSGDIADDLTLIRAVPPCRRVAENPTRPRM